MDFLIKLFIIMYTDIEFSQQLDFQFELVT